MAQRARILAQAAVDPIIIAIVLDYAIELDSKADALDQSADRATIPTSLSNEIPNLEAEKRWHYRRLAEQAISNAVMSEDQNTADWFLAFAKTMTALADSLEERSPQQ
ncbi:MAG TPA: hypothetical protein VK629_11895 [Steroidobacteraceae bacterium]|nr:hypothetical protein [Steroidobacteraceae bacterium]